MSENIKVSEVSDILRHQLEGIDTRVQLDEIGTVLQVSDTSPYPCGITAVIC